MSKVMFSISYEIKSEKRDEYLALSGRMKAHLATTNGKNYSIYEQKGKKNNFTEVFICQSMDEYEALEDQDEATTSMVQELDGMLADGKMKYITLIEL